MNSKIINRIAVMLVFFGLITLFSLHLKHHHSQDEVTAGESEEFTEEWAHIAVGFPASVAGVLLLVLAERRDLAVVSKKH